MSIDVDKEKWKKVVYKDKYYLNASCPLKIFVMYM